MVRRYAIRCLILLLSINYVRNIRVSSPKLFMDLGTNDPNHTLTGPFKVSGKALQATYLRKPCRVMCALKVSRCSSDSLVLLYISVRGT